MLNLRTFDADVEAHIKERYGHLDKNGQGRERYRLHSLIRSARPGNYAWQILEAELGYQGDYQPADHGMNWGDNQ